MVDFAKLLQDLNDPELQAQHKAEREAEQAKIEAKDKVLRDVVNLLTDHDVMENLPANERGLVRSCQSLISRYSVLSPAQEKWLFDIAKRHGYQPTAAVTNEAGIEPPSDPVQDVDADSTDRP